MTRRQLWLNHRSKALHRIAKRLRSTANEHEVLLWRHLARQVAPHQWEWQVPLPPYWIADFMCRHCKLIVEIDGASHDLKAIEDRERDLALAASGYRIRRYSDVRVEFELQSILKELRTTPHQC
jgi:very-short-patch-repair endonuclease